MQGLGINVFIVPTLGARLGLDSNPFLVRQTSDGGFILARSSDLADGWSGFPDIETRPTDLEFGPGGIVLKGGELLK